MEINKEKEIQYLTSKVHELQEKMENYNAMSQHSLQMPMQKLHTVLVENVNYAATKEVIANHFSGNVF